MGILDTIVDWLAEEPTMPPRIGSGDIERGVGVVAEAVAAEKAREAKRQAELARQAEIARQRAEREAREEDSCTRYHSTIVRPDSDMMFKSGSDCVQSCFDSDRGRSGRPRRPKPNLRAAVLSFSARLLMYVKQRCEGIGKVAYTRSGVSRQVYSRITCYDDSRVDKLTVMKFCIGLQLRRSDADLLMKSAGYAFSDTIPTDKAFTYAIENGIWNIRDVNEILVRNALPDLGLRF